MPWRWEWLPTPVFLPGEFHEQRSLVGYGPWGHKESDMIERLTPEKQRKVKKGLDISGEIVCAEVADFTGGWKIVTAQLLGVVTGPPRAGESRV